MTFSYSLLLDYYIIGEPTEKLDIPGFGEKFLGVEAGGVLNLYGEEKLSWTKITQHAPKFDPSAAELYNHKVQYKVTYFKTRDYTFWAVNRWTSQKLTIGYKLSNR